MAFDPAKLTEPPWELDADGWCPEADVWENQPFIALARNAYDVMMRRGWYPVPVESELWNVCTQGLAGKLPEEFWEAWRKLRFADPFTALVEADAWYREHVEGK